ncbi:MAG TPA: molybdenum cofactor guanylyltransferase MobA [Steroidobacteraceae bacterium]|nr:molybdenum cofactor guanylyltransferase MobA [Steroidobacteraceae bacterium]
MSLDISDITGLVLAGGRGSRMGGVDKGLQEHRGVPLALHALRRLAPQVGRAMLNANRNLAVYESMGVPVWPDEIADYPGPLAGMLAGLAHCATPYLATVPCDTPNFPLDLIAQLSGGLQESDSDIAMAFTQEDGKPRRQPVFSLMKVSVRESMVDFVRRGEGNVGLWASQQRCARVLFEDAGAFYNANTLAELQRLQGES